MTATQTATSAPAWRIAVIGVVAALAIGIGIVFGALMLDSRAVPIGSGATYVPASAPLYVEVRLEPSEAHDVALREFLGHFPPIEGVDLGEPLYGQLTAMLDEELAGQGTELSWAADVEPWFDGRVGFALLEVPDPTARPAEPDVEAFGTASGVVLIGVDDRAAAEASIDRIVAESDQADDLHRAGPRRRHHPRRGRVRRRLRAHRRPASAGTGPGRHRRGTQRARGRRHGPVRGGIDLCPADALPEDWLVFGIYDFTDALASALEGTAGASPGADAVRDLLAGQPLRGAMALTVEGDRVSVPMVSDPPGGSFTVTNAERGLADEVPGDALYFAEGGNVGDALSGLIGSLKESAGAVPDGAEQLDMIEAATGWRTRGAGRVDRRRRLGGRLRRRAVLGRHHPRADRHGGGAPHRGPAGDLRRTGDPRSVDRDHIEEREVEGVDVTTLRWEQPSAPDGASEGMPFAPSALVAEWAVTGDRVLIGIGDRFVERVIGLEPGDSLALEPRFADAIADLGGPSNAGVHGSTFAARGSRWRA